MIEDELAEKLINSEISENSDVKIFVEQGKISIKQLDLAKA